FSDLLSNRPAIRVSCPLGENDSRGDARLLEAARRALALPFASPLSTREQQALASAGGVRSTARDVPRFERPFDQDGAGEARWIGQHDVPADVRALGES